MVFPGRLARNLESTACQRQAEHYVGPLYLNGLCWHHSWIGMQLSLPLLTTCHENPHKPLPGRPSQHNSPACRCPSGPMTHSIMDTLDFSKEARKGTICLLVKTRHHSNCMEHGKSRVLYVEVAAPRQNKESVFSDQDGTCAAKAKARM